MASLERGREVRQRLGLDADNDLAFACESYAGRAPVGFSVGSGSWAGGGALPVAAPRSMVEWRKQLRRLAQQHVTQMDSQTIINAIHTWKELAHFQEDRGLELGESRDVPLFVLEGTDSPMRAIKSLQWLHDAGAMHWDPANVRAPEAPNTRTRKRQQAVVIEQGMIALLEEGIAVAEGNHDPEWLANWLCAVGGLWHRHIQLSTPQRLSASTLYSWCSQGKQAHARKGFAWSVRQWVSLGQEGPGGYPVTTRGQAVIVWPGLR